MSGMLKDWDSYYANHFKGYKTKDDVRDGCHPLIFKHGGTRNAIVLVHGLTDSPYFLREIGEYFCSEMGFDVYLPLLRAHGLKQPEDMKDASAARWKEDVAFALEAAQQSGGQISIGGLSTGGTLSVDLAMSQPQIINGGVFLFSAALGLANIDNIGGLGNLAEVLLRSPLAAFFDHLDHTSLANDSPSGNPYRYSKMDIGGAAELSKLIREVEQLMANHVVAQPLFTAHSEADTTADITDIEKLVARSPQAEMFRIGKCFNVPHASVVLKNPVLSRNNSPLESANPFFDSMLTAVHEFSKNHHLKSDS
jgi:esterase/lipase